MLKGLGTKIKGVFSEIKTYWKHPREGNFVSYKEMMFLALGCSGTIVINSIEIGFGVSCFLIGAIYKITFRDLYIIGLISMPFNFIYSPMNMIVVDNLGRVPKKTMRGMNCYLLPTMLIGLGLMFVPQNFLENIVPSFPQILGWILLFNALQIYYKKFIFQKLSKRFGKFRIWIITGALPCFAIMMLLVYLPFTEMLYINRLLVLNCLFSLFNLFKPFTDQRGAMQNVISPKSSERVKINTINTTLLAPMYGIMNVLMPILATYTGGLTNINTYRIIAPIFYGVGIPLCLILAFGVKDKVYVEEKHETNIGLFKGFKMIVKNKYLWINYISDNISAFSWGAINIVNVVVVYYMRQDWLLGIVSTVTGFCGFPGLFLAPLMIKKMGKKNVVLLARGLYLSYFVFAFLAISTNQVWLLFIGIIAYNLFNTAGNIARDSINPEIWDYQQYISGERMESSTGILNVLGTPIVTLMSMVIPLVYEKIGFTNDWNMMYVPEMRNKIFYITLLLAMFGHIAGTIPWFFYNLTDKKHKEIMDELELRAKAKSDAALVAAGDCTAVPTELAPEGCAAGNIPTGDVFSIGEAPESEGVTESATEVDDENE